MKLVWPLALLLAPLVAHAASSDACDALKQNVLTSAGCPASCSSPCVLYSPSQSGKCEAFQTSAPCLSDDSYVVPGATDKCNVTYQCLDALVNYDKRKWFLGVTKSSLSDKSVTTAAVTEIKQLKYDTGVSTVQLAGGLKRNARGDVQNVTLDESFFATPSSVVNFYLSELNLPPFLSKINFTSVKWTAIAFNNANLDSVPAGLSNLSLQYVEMAENYIKVINDSKPFTRVSTLKLQENDLTDLNIELPAALTLNLSGNPLSKIPDPVFRMTNLVTLSMRNCNLTNLHLTQEQFAFLAQRQNFDARPNALSCRGGYVGRRLPNNVGSACIPGAALDGQVVDIKSGGSSGNTTGIAIGVAAGVVVTLILEFLLYRRRRSNHIETCLLGDKPNRLSDDTACTDDWIGGPDSVWSYPDLLDMRIDHLDIEPIKRTRTARRCRT